MKYWFNSEFGGVVCDANNAEECFDMIIDIGFDYDGYSRAEDLKKLIDELVEYAKRGNQFICQGQITKQDTAEIDYASHLQAIKERDHYYELYK